MKQLNSQEIREAYGEPSTELEARTLRTLNALSEDKPSRRRFGGRRAAVPALVFSMLILGTALAITFRSEFAAKMGLPEATEALIQIPDAATATARTDMAVFTADAYLFDGVSLMADVHVEPNRSGIWVLPDGYENLLDYPALNIGVDMAGQTLREFAESMDIRQIRYVQVTCDIISGGNQEHFMINPVAYYGQDGNIHLLLSGFLPTGAGQAMDTEREMDAVIRFYVHFGAQPREDTLTLHLTGGTRIDTQQTSSVAEAIGITIRQVDIIRTPALTYYRVMYTSAPETGSRVNLIPSLEKDDASANLFQGRYYSRETQTGFLQGVLPPSAEADGRFTFCLRVKDQRSEPITVALPRSDH